MALIKCPECGKEISDKASSCPNCGCPVTTKENIRITFNNIRFLKNKKIICIISVIVFGIIILLYNKKHVRISCEEMDIYSSIEQVKEEILDPESLVVYNVYTYCYDPDYEKLRYTDENFIPKEFNEKLIEVYLHIGAKNSLGGMAELEYIFAYDLNNNLLIHSSNSDEMVYYYNNISTSPEEFICSQAGLIKEELVNNLKSFSREEVEKILSFDLNNKKIETELDFTEHTDKEKNELIYQCFLESISRKKIVDARIYMEKVFDSNIESECKKAINQYYYDSGIEELNNKNYDAARNEFEMIIDSDNKEHMIYRSYYEEAENEIEEAQNEKRAIEWDVLISNYKLANNYLDAKEKCEDAVKHKEYSDMLSDIKGKKAHLREIQTYFQENNGFEECDSVNNYIEKILTSNWVGDYELINDDPDVYKFKYMRIVATNPTMSYDESVVYWFTFSNSTQNLDEGDEFSSFTTFSGQYDGFFYEYMENKISDEDDDWGNIYINNGDGTITYMPYRSKAKYTYKYIENSDER